LEVARQEILGGERDARRLLGRMREVLKSEPEAEPDYVEIVDAESFEPVTLLRRECLAVLAVRVGAVRLLDNMHVAQREDGSFEVSL
jgi:pantoate--beta-alanine ligase